MSKSDHKPEEYEELVKNSTEINPDMEVKGTMLGVNIQTLIDYTIENPEETIIYTSERSDTPYPIGMSTKVETLTKMKELIETFGPSTISNIEEYEDGALEVGYHFD